MAARLVGFPAWQFLKDDGSVNAAGTLDFHEPKTSTDKSIWKDAAKATEHSNPVTLDSAGRPPNPIFTEGLYDVVVKDSDGTTLTTISNWGDNFSTSSEQSPNLVCNGSFEDDEDADDVPDEWTFDNGSSGARITTDRADGTASVKFTATSSSSDSILSCFFPVSANSAYEVSFEYKTSNANCTPKLEIQEYDSAQSTNGTETLFQPTTSATTWTKISYLRYVPDSGDYWAKLRFYANTAGTAYDTYIDNVQIKEISVLAPAAVLPSGLTLSRDTDTDHDINVTAGSVLADDLVYPLYLETEITKQGDAAWALGDDAGGGDTGAVLPADALVYVWLIGDSDTGRVDVLLSQSATSPTMPSGWDKKRLIGAWRCDSSNNLVAGIHKGTFFQFFEDLIDINDSTVTHQTYVTGTITVPPNCLGLVVGFLDIGNSAFDEELYLDLKPTTATYSSFADGAWIGASLSPGASQKIYESVMKEGTILVDSSSQFKYGMSSDAAISAGDATVKIYMRGFYMFTRDNP